VSEFTPDWKLLINGTDYANVAIADISHQAGREDIYLQPNPSYISISLVALQNQNYTFAINDGLSLQLKDSTGTYKTIFGGNITDISTSVNATGSVGTVYSYTLIALGSLARLAKTISDGVLTSDFDGDQIYALLTEFLLGDWNGVSAAQTWATYDATITWANAENLGLGEIDQPGQYEMVNRGSNADTITPIADCHVIVPDKVFHASEALTSFQDWNTAENSNGLRLSVRYNSLNDVLHDQPSTYP